MYLSNINIIDEEEDCFRCAWWESLMRWIQENDLNAHSKPRKFFLSVFS